MQVYGQVYALPRFGVTRVVQLMLCMHSCLFALCILYKAHNTHNQSAVDQDTLKYMEGRTPKFLVFLIKPISYKKIDIIGNQLTRH